jgi:hypothetical protein
MVSRICKFGGIALIACLVATPLPLLAEEAGTNITSQTGVLSNMSGGPPAVLWVELHAPKIGADYEVKVNFLKVETSASAIDAYIDYLNQEANKAGEESESKAWDAIREMLKKTESEADFEVFDAEGRSVGKAKNLGSTTFLRTVKFPATTERYRVKIRCLRGAGLYHLVFEWD